MYPAALGAAKYSKKNEKPVVSYSSLEVAMATDLKTINSWKSSRLDSLIDAVEGHDDNAMKLTIARIHYSNTDYEMAKAEFENVPIQARDAATWNNLGNTLLAVGNFKDAIRAYTHSRSEDEKDLGVALNRGLAFYLGGYTEQALNDLASAVHGAQGVQGAMDLLGLKASDQLKSRGDDNIAKEQLSLSRIQELLTVSLKSRPESMKVDLDSLSLEELFETAPSDSFSTFDTIESGDSNNLEKEVEEVEAGIAASRAANIETETLVDVLYWKESEK